jgi:hypothetical protein
MSENGREGHHVAIGWETLLNGRERREALAQH